MPYEKNLPEKIVVLHDGKGTKPILEAFARVLKANGITAVSELNAGVANIRKGWWIKIISAVESLSEQALGSKECNLPPVDVEMDPPAYLLFNSYLDCLNELMEKSGLTSDDAENTRIENKFILTRELLIRLVALALCNDMNGDRDGDVLLKILENFIAEISRENVLNNKGLIESNLSTVNIFLVTDHNKWFVFFKEMVGIIKFFNQNVTTLSKCLTHLVKTKHVIKSQLIAELNPNRKSTDLALDWVDRTLEDCERGLSENSSSSSSQKESRLITTDSKNKSNLFHLLRSQNSKFDVARIENLYKLLDETKIFEKCLQKMDMLNKAMGWIALMTGILKLDGLSKALALHGEKCEKLLVLKGDSAVFKKPVGKGLVAYQAASGYHLYTNALNCSSKLSELCNHNTLFEIVNFIESIINNLLTLQKELGIELFDKEKLENLKTLPSAPLAINPTDTKKILNSLGDQASVDLTNNAQKVQNTTKQITCSYKEKPMIRSVGSNKKIITRIVPMQDGVFICSLHDNYNGVLSALASLYIKNLRFFSEYYLQRWDLINNKCVEKIPLFGDRRSIVYIGLTKNNHLVINASYASTIIERNDKLYIWDGFKDDVTCVENFNNLRAILLGVFPDDRFLLHTHNEKKLTLWDFDFLHPLNTFDASEDIYNVEVISANIFAGVTQNNDILIWDKNNKNHQNVLKGHTQSIYALKRISDNLLASGSEDKTIRIWDVSSGKLMQTLVGHSNAISALAVLPDKCLASASLDGTIRLWDYHQGTCIQTLPCEGVTALAFFSDGRLISGDNKGGIFIYTFPELKIEEMQQLVITASDNQSALHENEQDRQATINSPNNVNNDDDNGNVETVRRSARK